MSYKPGRENKASDVHPKVGAAAIASIIVTAIVAILESQGTHIPVDVSAGVVAIVGFVAGFFKQA